MSRVFFILSILILFVQNIFSADEEINLEKCIYLKDTQWLLGKEETVTDKFLLEKFIPQLIGMKGKDKSITIIEVDSSRSEEKLDDILELNNIPSALKKSSFLRIVNFYIDFYQEDYHGTNRFNNININPILNGQKISFNIDGVEFEKLKYDDEDRWLWYHLNFDKIKVSSIDEEEIDLVPENKYALTQDISTNNIVVVNANEEHLKTLECLNPDFKIFNVEEVIDIEINQINDILKEKTEVYFKDRYFGSITMVEKEKSTISIKIDKSFCPLNKFVCLDNSSISFSKWDDIESELNNKYKTKSEKRKNWKIYKDFFEENNNNYFKEKINNYFKENSLAPKIKIISTTNNKISIGSVKLGTNEFADVYSFNDKIDEFSLNNQSTTKNQLILEYKVDNKCEKCIPNSIKTQYDIYSKDDDIEISLDEIDTSNLSNLKVNITPPPEGVEVYFKGNKVTTKTIDVPIHTKAIELEFRKKGYIPQIKVHEFNELLHLNEEGDVDCNDILTEWERNPWPIIRITNKGEAEAKIFVEIGTEELKPIEIATNKVSTININEIKKYNQLDQNKISVSINCDENKEQKFDIFRGDKKDIELEVKGIKKLWVDTLKNDEKIEYLRQFNRWAKNLKNSKQSTQDNAIERINNFVSKHNISEKDLKDLLELNEIIKNEDGDYILSPEKKGTILENLNNIDFSQQKKE